MSPPDKRRKRRNARSKASPPAVIDPRPPEEAAFVAAHEAVTQDRTQCAPKWRIEEPDGVVTVTPHTDDVGLWRAQIAAALGVRDRDAQTHLITQLACVFREGAADTNANAATALIREIGPRNAVEALLIAQMVAVHNAAAEQLRRVINYLYQPPEVIDSLSNQATRLLRLFIDQLAALDRLRGVGARQTVRVERVTVEAGGQAVVGAVTTTPVPASAAAPQGDGAPGA
jgi:hypothetical protein